MAWSGGTSERSRRYPKDWKRIRARILKRDNGLCRIRGRRCIGTATDVDHIVQRVPDDDSDSNLQSVCRPCHNQKTARENGALGGAVMKARAASRFRPQERHPSEDL